MKPTTKKEIPAETRELCSRVKTLRKLLKMPQIQFAASVGISQGHLCTIERGEQAPAKTFLLALCCRHKANEQWLVTGEGEPFLPAIADRGIPIYRRYPDFFGNPDEFDILGYLILPNLSKDAFGLLQRGDFMAPTIQANDIVVCDPAFDRIVNDDLLLVRNKWNTCLIRRYRMTEETAMLTPDNASYKPFPLRREMVIAKVVKVFRDVNF